LAGIASGLKRDEASKRGSGGKGITQGESKMNWGWGSQCKGINAAGGEGKFLIKHSFLDHKHLGGEI